MPVRHGEGGRELEQVARDGLAGDLDGVPRGRERQAVDLPEPVPHDVERLTVEEHPIARGLRHGAVLYVRDLSRRQIDAVEAAVAGVDDHHGAAIGAGDDAVGREGERRPERHRRAHERDERLHLAELRARADPEQLRPRRVRDVDGAVDMGEVVEEGRRGVRRLVGAQQFTALGVVHEHVPGGTAGDPQTSLRIDLHPDGDGGGALHEDLDVAALDVAAVDRAGGGAPDEEGGAVPVEGDPLREHPLAFEGIGLELRGGGHAQRQDEREEAGRDDPDHGVLLSPTPARLGTGRADRRDTRP